MSDQFFADEYRAAGFNPASDIVTKRAEAFAAIESEITPEQYLDCVRLYLNLPKRSELEWLRDGFFATDNSFSLVNNDREVTLLATLFLTSAVENEQLLPVLAILCGHASGLRAPAMRPELAARAEEVLNASSVEAREFYQINPQKLRELPAAKTTAASTAYSENATQELLIAAIKAAATDGRAAASGVGNEAAKLFSVLGAQMKALREEQSILWWFIGGQSTYAKGPFSELKVGPAAILIGSELAEMIDPPGPVSAPALMQRALATTQRPKAGPSSLSDIVSQIDEQVVAELLGDIEIENPELFPILTALERAREIGPAPNWHQSFTKLTHLKPDLKLPTLLLCVQIYREWLLFDLLAASQ